MERFEKSLGVLFDKDKCKGENMSAPKLKSVKASNDQIIPMQEASLDIWDKKYRLKDKESNPVDSDVNATYERMSQNNLVLSLIHLKCGKKSFCGHCSMEQYPQVE